MSAFTHDTQDELFRAPRTTEVSIQAKIVELERELKYRERLYPRWIDSGRMTRRTASQQLVILRAILEDYYALNRGTAS